MHITKLYFFLQRKRNYAWLWLDHSHLMLATKNAWHWLNGSKSGMEKPVPQLPTYIGLYSQALKYGWPVLAQFRLLESAFDRWYPALHCTFSCKEKALPWYFHSYNAMNVILKSNINGNPVLVWPKYFRERQLIRITWQLNLLEHYHIISGLVKASINRSKVTRLEQIQHLQF